MPLSLSFSLVRQLAVALASAPSVSSVPNPPFLNSERRLQTHSIPIQLHASVSSPFPRRAPREIHCAAMQEVQSLRLAALARDDDRPITDHRSRRLSYSFTNPFLSFVTVNDPSARAEILM